MPRVPGSKAQEVYSGVGFCQDLISDRACPLKKVHLVSSSYFKGNKTKERQQSNLIEIDSFLMNPLYMLIQNRFMNSLESANGTIVMNLFSRVKYSSMFR